MSAEAGSILSVCVRADMSERALTRLRVCTFAERVANLEMLCVKLKFFRSHVGECVYM